MNSKLTFTVVVSIFLLASIAVRIWDPAAIARIRFLVFDVFQKVEPRQYSPDLPVRIVALDDASIEAIGQWPWPRSVLVKMVENLRERGAAVVAFDLVLPEAERDPVAALLERLPDDPAAKKLLEQLRALPNDDQLLAGAISRQTTVLGAMAVSHATEKKPSPSAAFAHAGDDPRLFVPTYEGILTSVPKFHEAALGSGALNWVPDFDQIVRRIPLLVAVGEELYPAFSIETLRVVQGASTVIVRSSNSAHDEAFGEQTGIILLRIGDFDVPTDFRGQMWLRYTPSDERRFISAKDVIAGTVERDDIEGRIILVGATASGLLDLRSTPLEAAVPGVEIHAQAIEQMITGTHLQRSDFATGIELQIILVGGVLLSWLSYSTGATLGAIGGAIVTFLTVTGSYYSFVQYGFLIDPSYPVVVLTLVYLIGTVILYVLTERERNQVRLAFSHYMAPALIEQLAKEPDRLKLGGESRELTLLFSDVRDFTSISESFKSNPEGLTRLMNRLLSPLSRAIMERKGVIDKYIGDEIMAFWNAPIDDPDHAKNACAAALDMLQALEELNTELQQPQDDNVPGITPIRVGIGINTGECVVGNMGSDMRFDYSVLGDTVNLASRLEGQTKLYGVKIVLGHSTATQAMDAMAMLEIDTVRVVGKHDAEAIYCLLGKDELLANEDFQELQRLNNSMLASYRSQDWKTASALLDGLKIQSDKVTIDIDSYLFLYETRIVEYQENPPGKTWDGVYEAVSK